MVDNREFWTAITGSMMIEHEKISKLNIALAKAEATIEKMLQDRKINADHLHEEYNYIISEHVTMAYTQGLQEGAKLIHTLLSGQATDTMLMAYGSKANSLAEISGIKFAVKSDYEGS